MEGNKPAEESEWEMQELFEKINLDFQIGEQIIVLISGRNPGICAAGCLLESVRAAFDSEDNKALLFGVNDSEDEPCHLSVWIQV